MIPYKEPVTRLGSLADLGYTIIDSNFLIERSYHVSHD